MAKEWIDEENITAWFKTIIFGALIVAVFVVGFYLLHFSEGLSSENEDWGTFGDFVGGTVNSVLGFFSLLALLLTIILQRNEIRLVRRQLKISEEQLLKSSEVNEDHAKTAKYQLEAIQEQNNFTNYFKHRQAFIEYVEHLKSNHAYGEALLIFNYYHDIFPNAKQGDFKRNVEFIGIVDSKFSNIIRLLHAKPGHQNQNAFQIYMEIMEDIRFLNSRLGASYILEPPPVMHDYQKTDIPRLTLEKFVELIQFLASQVLMLLAFGEGDCPHDHILKVVQIALKKASSEEDSLIMWILDNEQKYRPILE